MLKVKNKNIGVGKPLVCISVMDENKDAIVQEVKRLVENGAEMIEWRVDAFEGVRSPNAA